MSKLAHSNQETMDEIELKAMDRDASIFAMHLLVPEQFLEPELKKMGGFDGENGDQIKVLARKFKVSETLMAMRLAIR